MKFAATFFLTLLASASAGPSATRALMSKARKLNNGDDGGNDDNQYSFLMNYQLKLVSCKAGEQIKDPETGELEYNAAVFRLCPDTCDDSNSLGCSSSYGDYVVGLDTFVQAYMEDERDNLNYDDKFKVDEYAQCRQYEQEANDDGQAQQAYYIGPACTENGKDIKLELFSDQYCSQAATDVTFEQISNGWTMPYSDGGLVSTSCISCTDYNNNGELRQMCTTLYEYSGKCETNMGSTSNNGKQEGSCDFISTLMPARKSGGSAGKAFGWVVFILVVVGAFSAYAMWWKKSKFSFF